MLEVLGRADTTIFRGRMAGILFIISAPSGSGKSTLVSQLRTLVEGLDFSVSYTTRAAAGVGGGWAGVSLYDAGRV